ncbi:MAG TPA: substrate-binding domain-containing protein, partial [Jiangellaceae bacterium]|nr:substrate-binding domain-containing protein [Jiangellaceae bacterium]
MGRRRASLAFASAAAVLLAACGSGNDPENATATGDGESTDAALSGEVVIDGSSTVFPLTSAAAELFQAENPGVQVSVGNSGTGGGFEKFCAGETD